MCYTTQRIQHHGFYLLNKSQQVYFRTDITNFNFTTEKNELILFESADF